MKSHVNLMLTPELNVAFLNGSCISLGHCNQTSPMSSGEFFADSILLSSNSQKYFSLKKYVFLLCH